MKKKTKNKLKKFFKNPLKVYGNYIKHTIIPKPYSHQVKMNIDISKGKQSGTALIPCTIYAMDHSIDLNPALIRKKDKKVVKCFDPKKYKFVEDMKVETYETKKDIVRYNPNNFVLELTEDEKAKGYVLKELERCKHCGQKLVMAELKQTRYRSCPSIHVKLGDPSKQDVTVPVEFGVNKSDITRTYWFIPSAIFVFVYFTLTTFGIEPLGFLKNTAFNTPLPGWSSYIIDGIVVAGIWLYMVPVMIYKSYRLLKWYKEVKPYMKRSKYPT